MDFVAHPYSWIYIRAFYIINFFTNLSEHKFCLSKKKFQWRSIKSCFLFSFLCDLFHLLYVSYHLCPLTENPYFVRSMTPSITQIKSWTIIMYFDPDLVCDLILHVLAIKIPHSLRLTWTYDKIIDNGKVLFPQCDQKITCPVGQILAISNCQWILHLGSYTNGFLCDLVVSPTSPSSSV